MLEIKNLHVKAGEREILKGVNLTVKDGEICVLFGPNGSGKSTLLSTIMGYSYITVTEGSIVFKEKDITHLPVDERARLGIGMMMQRPPNVDGVKLGALIKTAAADGRGETILADADDFKMKEFLDRDVNVGFSGGEIKRSELLQLTAQRPDFVLLDEPESGVDLQSIELIGNKIHALLHNEASCKLRNEGGAVSSLVITHTGQVLDYIGADKAYVMGEGKIRCSGRPMDLLKQIREKGYEECELCQTFIA